MEQPDKTNKINYYFDRLVINTSLKVSEVKKIIPREKLSEYNTVRWYGETSNTAKSHRYKTKVDLRDATEKIIEILSLTTNVANVKWGISYIEITKDIEFKTFKEAQQYQFYLERDLVRKWERERSIYEGQDNDTIYINIDPNTNRNPDSEENNEIEEKRKFVANGMVIYPIKSEKNPFSDKPVLHIEFRLKNWAKIKKILKIHSVSQLKSPEQLFEELEKRYLSTNMEINKELLIKHLIKHGVDPEYARFRAEGLNSIQDLRERYEIEKERVQRKINLRPLRKKLSGKTRNLNQYDKFVLNFRVGKYLREKRVNQS